MKLRSRIMIITFLIILFVQGLNCLLEIGFLANNLEENNLRKYRIIGNEIKRKLDISLVFGKPLAQINYTRLLKDIIPDDIDNLHVIDREGKLVYSARKTEETGAFRPAQTFKREKNLASYTLFIPLKDRSQVRGNLVLVVSHRQIQEKLLYLIRSSVLNFLLIVAISLPVLFFLLTWFINRPYKFFIRRIDELAAKADVEGLKAEGIDLLPLDQAEVVLRQVKKAPWLRRENRDLYDQMDSAEPAGDRDEWERGVERKLSQLMNAN